MMYFKQFYLGCLAHASYLIGSEGVGAVVDPQREHVPGALNIGLGGQFASWTGSLVPPAAEIVSVADNEEEVDEAFTRLARVGLEKVRGFLQGGMCARDQAGNETATVEQIAVDELNSRTQEDETLQILDVRKPAEFRDGHVSRASNIPLADLRKRLVELDPAASFAVICQGGYRSSAATSILAANGFDRITNVVGGTEAWIGCGLEVEKVAASQ